MIEEDLALSMEIAKRIKEAGGTAYYVGGFVRDRLLGLENKDIDIEVHGIEKEKLESLLSQFGRVMTVGVSFGVFMIKYHDIDIALPRQEIKTGETHRDFDIIENPFLSNEDACRRRDFTINAMMQDIVTGEIVDYFHGMDDLHQKIIRHVDAKTFVEDPLRVLRGAQFAARLNFEIHPSTMELCSTMSLTALSRERIFTELEKALLKAEKPSLFFENMRKMNQLSYWFKELSDLIGIPQDPLYHKEGDAYVHTLMVVDAAASLRSQAKEPLWFMLSALCHDFGKAITTTIEPSGRIHSLQHETKGLPLVHTFLLRITNENKLISYVMNMVLLHMKPNMQAQSRARIKTTNKMFDESLCPEDLLLLAKADRMGQIHDSPYEENERFLKERLSLFQEMMARPYVMGDDLIANGIHPGPLFKEALDYAHLLRLAGVEKESALRQTLSYIKKKE